MRSKVLQNFFISQFQPNTSAAVASIRTFRFSVLNITVIYKTTFTMPAIP